MKRVGILMVVMLTVSLSWGQSYKTAIGIKGGFPYYGTLDVKHDFGGGYGEFRIGGGRYDWFIQGLYEKNYGLGSGFEWYWGVGAHVGFWNYGPYYAGYNGHYYHDGKYYGNSSYVGLDAVAGIEYTFDKIPLNLAADFGPSFNFAPYGYLYWGGALAARIAIK